MYTSALTKGSTTTLCTRKRGEITVKCVKTCHVTNFDMYIRMVFIKIIYSKTCLKWKPVKMEKIFGLINISYRNYPL